MHHSHSNRSRIKPGLPRSIERGTPRRRTNQNITRVVRAVCESLENRCLFDSTSSEFSITDLGTLGGRNSYAYGINDNSQVVGQADTATSSHAFLYSNGMMSDLSILPGDSASIARAINDSGQIVGDSYTALNARHGFIETNGSFLDIGPALNQVTGINSSGVVAGYGPWGGKPYNAYAYDSVHGLTQIPLLNVGSVANALGINDSGQIVGSDNDGPWTAYVYDLTTAALTPLPTLGGPEGNAYAINDNGQIVGSSSPEDLQQRHAFLYDTHDHSIRDLGNLGGGFSAAWALNNSGLIVGESTAVSGDDHAFLYRYGAMTDLNNLIPAGSGWTLTKATGINALGQIIGNGSIDGAVHAFLLTPHLTITSADHVTFAVGITASFTIHAAGIPMPEILESGSLPQNISFFGNADDGTATISGTPLAGTEGTYPLTLTAKGGTHTFTQSFTLTVADPQPPAFTSVDHATLEAGRAGSFPITTTGVPNASLTEIGALPDGVKFADNGDGTASLTAKQSAGAVGTYDITLTADNTISPTATQAFTLTIAPFAPRTIDVDSHTPASASNQDGKTWATAYASLQVALANAAAGDTIDVAQGTYFPTTGTDRAASFQLVNGMAIYGGFAGDTTANPGTRDVNAYCTILSGNIGAPGDNSDNSYHVVTVSGSGVATSLDGFTISAGNANGGGVGEQNGGGISNLGANLSVTNCTFGNNFALEAGGAMYNSTSPSVTLSHCLFTHNTAGSSNSSGDGAGMKNVGCVVEVSDCMFDENMAHGSGGGVYNDPSSGNFTNCVFNANFAWEGAGIENDYCTAPLMFTGCTFQGNTLGEQLVRGAGMSNSNSSPELTRCNFINNSSGTIALGNSAGGGIYDNTLSSPKLTDCVFSGNAADNGAGIYNADRSSPNCGNCAFSGNLAKMTPGGAGGAVFTQDSGSTFDNCQFIGNSAFEGGGIFTQAIRSNPSLSVTNCIFSGNRATSAGGAVSFSYTVPASLTNCVFSGNVASLGGAMEIQGLSATLTNCTFTANTASAQGGAIWTANANADTSLNLNNCILLADSSPNNLEIDGDMSTAATYSDIQGGMTGTGNIDADPKFLRNPSPGPDNTWGTADDDYGDLQLRITSPCIDVGDNTAVPNSISTDLAGNPRFIDVPTINDPGAIVDMGAYEYTLPLAGVTGSFVTNALTPTIQITFNGDLDSSTLAFDDLTADAGSATSVVYDPATRTASWALAGPLPDGNHTATLSANGVKDGVGDMLSAQFQVHFFTLAGDANHDRTVNLLDLNALATSFGKSGSFSQGDFDYSGTVGMADFNLLAMNFGTYLAPPPSSAPPVLDAAMAQAPAQAPSGLFAGILISSEGDLKTLLN
jgi:probable HAF family extracellular repeat protein